MLKFLVSIFKWCNRQHETKRLQSLREQDHRWQCIPYGEPVQVKKAWPDTTLPIGTVGRVLSKKGHGIEEYPGYTTLTPNYPAIRGVHVMVDFGRGRIKLWNLGDLAPA